MEKLTDAESCPARSRLATPPPEIAATLGVLGGKWKVLILWRLLARTSRFNELRRAIPGISQHMLTTSLRQLEEERIVARQVFAETPPRVEYRLTDHGATLGHLLRAMAEWGGTHLTQVG